MSNLSRRPRVVAAWAPAAVVMLAIFMTSSLESVPPVPGRFADKIVHFVAYALLGACVLRGLTDRVLANATGTRAFQAWGLSALYGASDEWHQSFVPGRTAAFDDWLADAAGAAAAVIVVLLVRWVGLPGRTI